MESSDQAQEEALRFAEVWKRVMPEGGGPVLPALQTLPEEEPRQEPEAEFFRRQVAGELALGRAAWLLARRTGAAELYDCASCAARRGRRLAALCYLEGGLWLLEGDAACPDPAAAGREGDAACPDPAAAGREGLRQLYQALEGLAQGYRTEQERTRQTALSTLCLECGTECRRWQARLRGLLARWWGNQF
ncbi:MAG: hypothetical protein LUG45_07720 [Clostridiales bacterium]|nr:hypothetical protein [Clostridiales bacterium]